MTSSQADRQWLLAEVDRLTKRAEVAEGLLRISDRAWAAAKRRAEQAETKIAELRKLLDEAADDIVHWGSYADDYFQIKWDLEGDIARYRKASRADG